MKKVEVGGQRLGSGKKMQVQYKNYERSTHDLSYIWRSTMAAGTLVPFMTEIGLNGDTFDINLNTNVMTHPTVGPLFGSYKVQLDVFQIPIRLYQAQLHNNKLGIGMNMSKIKLPQLEVKANPIDYNKGDIDNQQINPSCILSYLNIRGIGSYAGEGSHALKRYFNAIPYLAYWDIYKNYYANKQEEVGAVIHQGTEEGTLPTIRKVGITNSMGQPGNITLIPQKGTELISPIWPKETDQLLVFYGEGKQPTPDDIKLSVARADLAFEPTLWWQDWTYDTFEGEPVLYFTNRTEETIAITNYVTREEEIKESEPKIHLFPLKNIDDMREDILSKVKIQTPYIINQNTPAPYGLPFQTDGNAFWSKQTNQEGLALKTYQSDLFNNWISTEWISGTNGISEITAVSTEEGKFTMDTLNMAQKVYEMLNRIAISGGSYDDWQEAVYGVEAVRRAETPMYMGGLIKELVFEEVVSNAEAGSEGVEQPLGTLAGKGKLSKKHKGGEITIKVDEPSYIMGIISLTPRVDYSQGNKWDTNLKTMDDLHKPALDEIGFQDLITDQMAWWDSIANSDGETQFKSAGKQPAWMNYMTNVNQVRGNFAIENNEMFMTLNRKYENDGNGKIKDLTTYIDPVKYNHIFAQTSRDAQNFWSQISVNITARRKMSAKIMPNL